jgi:hypothetical protein
MRSLEDSLRMSGGVIRHMKTDRVQLSKDLSVFVSTRIANYAHECEAQHQWLIPYVEKHAILPLYLGLVETFGILPDGRIRKFSADGEHSEYEELMSVEEFNQFMAAIVNGAKRYPGLTSAIPARPGNASTCEVTPTSRTVG